MKTQTMIVDQMNAWDNEDCETKPDDDAPHGQKCLYKVSVFEFMLLRTLLLNIAILKCVFYSVQRQAGDRSKRHNSILKF